MGKGKIKVLIVDDSVVCQEVMTAFLGQAPDIEVVGTASSGKEAILRNEELKPDLITMDLLMPGMDGFQTVEEIMATRPTPILVVTSEPVVNGVDKTFRALTVGALDLIRKPDPLKEPVNALIDKIRTLAGVVVIKRHKKISRVTCPDPSAVPARTLFGIASSTGGPKVLLSLLGALGRDFPGTILVVQHLPVGFHESFAAFLNNELTLDVSLARENEEIRPGRVLLAPADHHMYLRSPSRIGLGRSHLVCGQRPSGTVLFQSMARVCPGICAGIVLTGMGRDGAEGLLELKTAGGLCVAQDEASSIVFGMPKVAVELQAVERILNVEELRHFLVTMGRCR
jgi:two-component system, chemotaxis family, protein-glutamate methylesterase/glutaminase